MSYYFEAISGGLGNVFSWPGILIPIAGTMLAMITSFLPGIGGSSVAAVAIMLTVTWDPEPVLLLFGALTGGATFMGSITAILFNIPGSASAAATLIDGYPLGQKGYSKTAIACAATASAVGSIVGVVVLISILPVIRPVLLEFGPLERLLLGIWGLTTIIAIPNSSALKAAAMTVLGLLVAMIGSDPTSGSPRWAFGSIHMYGGFNTIPVLLGLFTIAELISWTKRYDLESPEYKRTKSEDSVWRGVTSVFNHKLLTLRSSLIGTIVGIIPGVGGTVAGFVSYGQAVQTAKDDRSEFGKGDIRGLIAPEAAIDAKDGGSLLPAIAFGLPGSEAGIILVTMLGIHGLTPGLPMLSEHLPLTFTLIFALLFSNILTSVLGVSMTPYLAKLSTLRIDRIALPALVVSMVAIVQLNGQLSDLYIAIAFGIAGFYFKRYDWPRVPFIIAFILGSFIESNLELSVRLIDLGRISPFERPATLIILVLLMLSIFWMISKPKPSTDKCVWRGGDIVVLATLGSAAAVFVMSAFMGGAAYSYIPKMTALLLVVTVVFALVTQLTTIRAVLADFIFRKGSLAERINIPTSNLRPLIALVLILPGIIVLGFTLSTGALVFFWTLSSRVASGRNITLSGIWAGGTVLSVHYFVVEIAHVILPGGIIAKLLI